MVIVFLIKMYYQKEVFQSCLRTHRKDMGLGCLKYVTYYVLEICRKCLWSYILLPLGR